MIWWLNEIDKFYNYLKKRVLRDKFATEGTMKKKIHGPKKSFPWAKKIYSRGVQPIFYFLFFCKELFWLAYHQKKNQFETFHTPQIEVWRCFPLDHLCKLWKLDFGPKQWDKVWWLLGTSWGTHWELGKLFRNHWAPVKTHRAQIMETCCSIHKTVCHHCWPGL